MVDLLGKRIPCPDCGGRKCLARYDDGEYCFKCGRDTRDKTNKIIGRSYKVVTQVDNQVYDIKPLPEKYIRYLSQYGLDTIEVEHYNLSYTEEYGGRLFIPVYSGSGELIFCQFKDIEHNENSRLPKAISKGQKPFIYFTRFGYSGSPLNDTEPVVIVEDPFSAIKVSQVATAFCLFGNTMARRLLKDFVKINNKVVIWLDNDEGGYVGAAKLTQQLRPFLDRRILFTDKDPKFYNNMQLKEFIYE